MFIRKRRNRSFVIERSFFMKNYLNQICEYLIGKIELNKAQLRSALNKVMKDELETFKLIQFLYKRNLIEPNAKTVDKLFKVIVTAKYAKWLLRYNLPYDRIRLIKLVANKKNMASEVLFDRLPFSEEESLYLFKSALDASTMIMLLNIPLTAKQKQYLKDNQSQVNEYMNICEKLLNYQNNEKVSNNFYQAKTILQEIYQEEVKE